MRFLVLRRECSVIHGHESQAITNLHTIIEPNIEALRAALVIGYVEDTLIDGLSTQEIASALQALFDVTAADVMAHPDYHGDLKGLSHP